MKTRLYLLLFALLPFQARSQDLESIRDQKPFAVSGYLDLRTIGYSAKGIDPRRSPFTYILSGSPVFSFYGLTIPVSFTYSEQDRAFRQPFNQFGLSPTYKWITLHGGYRNLSFSPYTLAGHTMLGGGFELRPGKFRLAFITGRLNRATAIDTTTGVVQPYSFSRYGTAVKIGYGTEKSFVNLSVLSAKDSEKNFKGAADSSALRPAANTVIGGDLKVTLVGDLFLFADGGLSIYTRDNTSTIGIDSSVKILETLQKIMPLNATSNYALAYSGGLGYKSKHFGIHAAYKYVDPDFISMGAYFFQNDLRNITLSPSFNALKGRLRFNGSIGVQDDNQRKLKQASTRRIISMANLTWDFTDKLGIDANYSNFSTNSEPTVAMIENRYLLAQTNSNLSVNPRLILAGQKTTQVILLSFNQSNLKDLNQDTQSANDIRSSVAFFNYNLTLNQLGLSLTTGLNYTVNKLASGDITNQGISLGASKAFLKHKLMVSTVNSWVATELEAGKGNILNLGGNITYMPLKGHRIGLRVSSLNNSTSREGIDEPVKFSELTGELGYTFSF
ncbi:MAG: hypothetical protein KF870_10875 [Leadbetterella sp.]|nr:hypothetical protein [Leadbetterella sp.]